MLVSALSQLGRELTTPLEHLRSDLIHRLSESPDPAFSALAETCRPETLVQLCDDLVRLTRVFFDQAAIGARALKPRSDGRLRLSALIDEIDRRFASEAASRTLGWRCRLEGPDTALVTDPLWTRQALGRAIDEALSQARKGGEVTVLARTDGAIATIWIQVQDHRPSLALQLESDEPEHCALGFARSLLERQGGGLECSDGPSGLLLHMPA
jgi:hypothetical protein